MLNSLRAQMRALQNKPGLGSLSLGWQKGDTLISRIGSRWLADRAQELAPGPNGPDLFIATTLYKVGGHTALIGDFVRALAEMSPGAQPPHLIVTNCNGEHSCSLGPEIIERTAMAPGKIDILPGPDLSDRLEQLFERVSQLRPRWLFLFHHPDDPVACAIAQPEIVGETFLVHHADSNPSFGLHLPGVRIVDLTPPAAAFTRAQELASTLLLLTARDPGPRPIGFLQRGNLVTATCGTYHKFKGNFRYRYADAVARILRTTRGWHVHIGPLEESQLSDIRNAIGAQKIDAERFKYVPWADSLAATLWEHGCDLYFASFPITGARTDVEVFGSATPHLCYTARLKEVPFHDELRPEGDLFWCSWEELDAVLKSVLNSETLKQRSTSMRAIYDKLHHPRVFASTLRNILEGKNGFADPHESDRERRAVQRLRDSLQTASTALRSTSSEFSIARLQEAIDRAAES